MDSQSINRNPFVGRTATTPRPSPETYRGPESALTREQAQWDFAQKWDQDNQQRRRDHIAGVDARRAQRRRADQERRIADQLAPAKAAFLANGGTEAAWQSQKDSIAVEIAHRAAVAAVTEPDPEVVRLRRSGAYTL